MSTIFSCKVCWKSKSGQPPQEENELLTNLGKICSICSKGKK